MWSDIERPYIMQKGLDCVVATLLEHSNVLLDLSLVLKLTKLIRHDSSDRGPLLVRNHRRGRYLWNIKRIRTKIHVPTTLRYHASPTLTTQPVLGNLYICAPTTRAFRLSVVN